MKLNDVVTKYVIKLLTGLEIIVYYEAGHYYVRDY